MSKGQEKEIPGKWNKQLVCAPESGIEGTKRNQHGGTWWDWGWVAMVVGREKPAEHCALG